MATPIASSLNKRKYADKEAEDFTVTSKKRRGDDNDDNGDGTSSSSEVEVSFEEEPVR
jgi:hypothetical protein